MPRHLRNCPRTLVFPGVKIGVDDGVRQSLSRRVPACDTECLFLRQPATDIAPSCPPVPARGGESVSFLLAPRDALVIRVPAPSDGFHFTGDRIVGVLGSVAGLFLSVAQRLSRGLRHLAAR